MLSLAILAPALAGLLQRILPLEGPYPLTASRLVEALGGGASVTGRSVTPELSLSIAAVWACVRVICDNVASLPIHLLRRLDERGKDRATSHPLYRLLHDEPNPWMTPFTFKETLQGHLLLWGNAYAEIVRDRAGQPVALWPLRPPDVYAIKRAASGELLYTYRVPMRGGTVLDQTGMPQAGEIVEIPQRDMFHLRGLSGNGVVGYSPITLHREALGLALAAEEYGARFFGNNARPGGVLQAKGRLRADAVASLKESWETAHRGLSEAHRVAILEEGIEWKQVGIPPEDAQFLETRQFQLTEISRIFRVPPHKISDLNRATYSNVDKQEQQFMLDALRPWLVRWEEQISKDLIVPRERASYFAEFLMEAQWRADIKTRYDAYSKGRQWGWLSANDIREFENMNPVEGGDDYWMPVNVQAMGGKTVEPMQPAAGADDEDSRRYEYERLLREVMSTRSVRRRIERDEEGRISAVIETPVLPRMAETPLLAVGVH